METKHIIILFLLTIRIDAAIAEWTRIVETDTATFYMDISTIRKEGNTVKVWSILDFKEKGDYGDVSHKSRYEFDCKQERIKTLTLLPYAGHMAEGQLINYSRSSEEWFDIPPGSNWAIYLEILCKK